MSKVIQHTHIIHLIQHIHGQVQVQHIKYQIYVLNLFKVNSRDANRDINLTTFVFDLKQVTSGCLVIPMKFLRLLPNLLEVYQEHLKFFQGRGTKNNKKE